MTLVLPKPLEFEFAVQGLAYGKTSRTSDLDGTSGFSGGVSDFAFDFF
jgi:hypothetical protein